LKAVFGRWKPTKSVTSPPTGIIPWTIRPSVGAPALDPIVDDRPVLCLTPRGRRFSQCDAARLASGDGVILVCGRYEGIDQRVVEARGMEEISLGDFVLSGGEPAALVLLDTIIRLLPGVMGAAESAIEESFSNGLLEYPHYTRPAEWRGRRVPDVLLSGHHGAVATWRREQSEQLTQERRPDLWAVHTAGLLVPGPQANVMSKGRLP
jgi:tRNA (guanine37-N1)-methyltransferase